MRKAYDSTQLERLRRDFTKVTKDRQAWATRARKAEKALAGVRFEIAELTKRFDRFLSGQSEGDA